MVGLWEEQRLRSGRHWSVPPGGSSRGRCGHGLGQVCHWSGLGCWAVELVKSDKLGEKSNCGELEELPPERALVLQSQVPGTLFWSPSRGHTVH